MNEFLLYFKIGLNHVLDYNAYDHVLFFIALIIPYSFKDWIKVLQLVTVFTIGHTVSLLLSVYNLISINSELVEFLIPISILITALFHLFTAGKNTKSGFNLEIGFTLFFGIIHGLGFANYFKSMIVGEKVKQIIALLEFALGIEAAQITVVFIVLALSYIFQNFIRFSKRDWAIMIASFVIGVVLPIVLNSTFIN